jgi:hypothetical protein
MKLETLKLEIKKIIQERSINAIAKLQQKNIENISKALEFYKKNKHTDKKEAFIKVLKKLGVEKANLAGELDLQVSAKYRDAEYKGESVVNEKINPKFYNARVQWIDPKSKKKFVGDVVRYDNGEYKVNLGKDGRFEKYILAKEKDLKIVSKSKKKTFESVNEAIKYDKEGFVTKMINGAGKLVKSINLDGESFSLKGNKYVSKKGGKDLHKSHLGINESINEGKKRYYQQNRVGSAKYTISYHDGKQKHKDGSDFFGIQTFKNKKDLAKFVNTLHKGGYVYGFNESVKEEVPQGFKNK